MDRVVGTCGNCGGPVVIPISYMGLYPPKPTCVRCGSTTRASNDPVLPMNPPPEHRIIDSISTVESVPMLPGIEGALELITDAIKLLRQSKPTKKGRR